MIRRMEADLKKYLSDPTYISSVPITPAWWIEHWQELYGAEPLDGDRLLLFQTERNDQGVLDDIEVDAVLAHEADGTWVAIFDSLSIRHSSQRLGTPCRTWIGAPRRLPRLPVRFADMEEQSDSCCIVFPDSLRIAMLTAGGDFEVWAGMKVLLYEEAYDSAGRLDDQEVLAQLSFDDTRKLWTASFRSDQVRHTSDRLRQYQTMDNMTLRIYIDFHKTDLLDRFPGKEVVPLTCAGTFFDLQRQNVTLVEGMPVMLQMDDANDYGEYDELEMDAFLAYVPEPNFWHAHWYAVFDPHGFRHTSDRLGERWRLW